jgi:hypothetical protein
VLVVGPGLGRDPLVLRAVAKIMTLARNKDIPMGERLWAIRGGVACPSHMLSRSSRALSFIRSASLTYPAVHTCLARSLIHLRAFTDPLVVTCCCCQWWTRTRCGWWRTSRPWSGDTRSPYSRPMLSSSQDWWVRSLRTGTEIASLGLHTDTEIAPERPGSGDTRSPYSHPMPSSSQDWSVSLPTCKRILSGRPQVDGTVAGRGSGASHPGSH